MDADELYGLPLDRFVSERGVLAKALRAGGRREDAAAVAALRRPSVAGWAVNQLVRTQHAALQELFAAGDELRAAQAALLAGSGDGRTLRTAGERERAAVDALVDAARGLLTSQGEDLSATTIERVSDTLHAAALDESAREQVREGRLERELRHVGLGIGDSAAAAFAPARPAPGKARASKPVPAPERAARPARGAAGGTAAKPEHDDDEQTERASDRRLREAQERAAAEDAQRERAAARTAARAAEAKAQRRAQSAARALDAAQRRRDEAAAALAEAQDAVAREREAASLADAELQAAQAALERALRDR